MVMTRLRVFGSAVRVFLCVVAFAGMANVLSYFVLSDGFGLRPGNDGIIRVGWPCLMLERGGIDGRDEFYSDRALRNLIIAIAIAVVISGAWYVIRRRSSSSADL
jgi:hypothetical protein